MCLPSAGSADVIVRCRRPIGKSGSTWSFPFLRMKGRRIRSNGAANGSIIFPKKNGLVGGEARLRTHGDVHSFTRLINHHQWECHRDPRDEENSARKTECVSGPSTLSSLNGCGAAETTKPMTLRGNTGFGYTRSERRRVSSTEGFYSTKLSRLSLTTMLAASVKPFTSEASHHLSIAKMQATTLPRTRIQ